MACVVPVVEHWPEWEIVQWFHQEMEDGGVVKMAFVVDLVQQAL